MMRAIFGMSKFAYPLNEIPMKRISLLLATLATLLLLSGCLGNTGDGPSLFKDDKKEESGEVVDNEAGNEDENAEIDAEPTEEPVEEEDYEGGEFGFRVEDTVCIRQLHGGCVPYDYGRYLGDSLGIHFRTPTDWFSAAADDSELLFFPSDRENGDADVTRLFVWRSSHPKFPEYKLFLPTVIDEGDGDIGDYRARFTVAKGSWNDQPIKAEWVELILDKDVPWSNFVFFLITEPKNFAKDQAVLKAAVSSILEGDVD